VILLDTHIVVWLTIEPQKLTGPEAKAIAEARAGSRGIGIADVTLLELAMLGTLGRIRPAIPLGLYLEKVEEMFEVFPITAAIAARSMQFSEAYPRDSAGRLIGAAASVHGIPLVTRDGAIRLSGEVNCVG
jgi:PIN domain nuclease of toxin-antitoxin system